ncbi:MAG: efflux RND transporter periplasmic adaptor subunit [Bacteroidaceae bacterium]|nr:efflux RND transporter periplasmic adaptor subunit [Bacteroidaceae bacterium]MBR1520388.1 efflux RND transporter periplasmic adaptor subunit [Bacteroidaceae bacterium]
MKKFFKWAGIALIAAIFIGTFVFLYQKSQPKVTTYEINTAEVKDIEKTTIITGKIEPRDEVNIKPQISGIITALYKQAGDIVKKDEVIAKVKVIPDMSSLSSAENRVKLAEISLKQAQTDFDRMKNLYNEKVVSAEDYEKAEVSLKNAKAEMSNAKDALNIVRDGISLSNAQMSTTLIRSTIDGLVLDVPVKVGNSVILSNSFNDGTTIATVANMQDLIFRGKIDETEVGRITEGMPVQITVGAIQDLKLSATLEYISPKGVEENGANMFEIKAAIQLPADVKIRSGYSANAEIVLEHATKTICVPEASLEFEGDSTYVYLLTDSTSSVQQFRRIPVTTGISDGIHIEVKKGLKVGEKVRGIEKIEKE